MILVGLKIVVASTDLSFVASLQLLPLGIPSTTKIRHCQYNQPTRCRTKYECEYTIRQRPTLSSLTFKSTFKQLNSKLFFQNDDDDSTTSNSNETETQAPSVKGSKDIKKSTLICLEEDEDDEVEDQNDQDLTKKDTNVNNKRPTPAPAPVPSNMIPNNDEELCPLNSCLLTSLLPSIPSTSFPSTSKTSPPTTSSQQSSSSSQFLLSDPYSFLSNNNNQQSNFLLNPVLIIPILSPILAYATYDDVAKTFNTFIDILNVKRSWVPVDGGAYQARIIAPAINGIVVPAISILFATLISNTVSTLRQRQIDIHTFLNKEAGELRLLSSMVESFPDACDQKMKCIDYLIQYTSRLIAESSSGDNVGGNGSATTTGGGGGSIDGRFLNWNGRNTIVELQGSTDSEMNGVVSMLNELSTLDYYYHNNNEYDNDHNGEDESSSKKMMKKKNLKPPDTILSESYGAVVRLNSLRSARITALQSTYPILHYAILSTLAGSICLAFLIETNQELLIFLNAIQLRVLWTMLIGTFSALGVVCYDLSGPFRGQYQISNAVYQLMTIRDALKVVCCMKDDD